MKETLKRLFGSAPTIPALEAETVKEEVNMTTDVTNVGDVLAASTEDQTAALTATVTALTEQLTAATDKIAELTALVEAAGEFKAAQEKAAAEAIVAARVEKLTALVGTDQATSLQAATASMDASAFDALVAAMSFKSTKEAATPAFKEVGAEGNTDQAKLAAEVYGGKTSDYLQNLIATNQLN